MSRTITNINQLDLNKSYTYSDYLKWRFSEMVELIKGRVVRMSPAPSREHQEISFELLLVLGQYFRKKQCKVYHAPFDVRLPLPSNDGQQEPINTVVQPDICVVCDLSKLDQQGCNGAPDWIIEILSPATSKKDLTEKFDLYQQAGVKEYWVVHPSEATIIPYRLNTQGQYETLRPTPFVKGEHIPSGLFPDLLVDLDSIFEN